MKQTIVFMLALCLLLASCVNNVQKSTDKAQIRTGHQKDEPKQTAEEIAHANGCMTVDEFKSMKYSYVIEKSLPCLVYLERIHIEDIVSKIPEEGVVFDPIIEVSTSVQIGDYEGSPYTDCDSETGWSLQSEWCGAPSDRNNECWIKGSFKGSDYLTSIHGYLGIDSNQVDLVIRKAKSVKYDFQDLEKTPMIIRVYQTRNGGSSVKADLVAILNEE